MQNLFCYITYFLKYFTRIGKIHQSELRYSTKRFLRWVSQHIWVGNFGVDISEVVGKIENLLF